MPRSSILKVAAETRATTASVQDYLAAIYDLTSSGRPVIGARLAKHMGISAPAVTEAIHRMARGGYVKIGRGKVLALSNKGRQIAEVMARRHRLLERWLTDTLGLNWTDAHEEAHRLEHALSPRVEDRLAELLGMPSTCPHGNPIPGMAKPPRVEPFPLNQAKEGTTVVVERITEEAEAERDDLGLSGGCEWMKVLFWIFVAIGCVYAFYTGAMAVWSYLEITSIVEEVVNERASRTDRQDRAGRGRDDIVKKVAASDIPIDEHSISVSNKNKTLEIGMRWN